jgi:hypothetical protein
MSSGSDNESVGFEFHGSSMSGPEMPIDASVFFRGVLFALRECQEEFAAEGVKFHSAFRKMLESAMDEPMLAPAARRMLENFDPVFGVFPEATEMLLEGERDFIVSLENPRLRVAKFKVDKDEARSELDELPCAEVFRKLAARLHEQLNAA